MQTMTKLPQLSESPTRAEILAWYAAAEKQVAEIMAQAKLKKSTSLEFKPVTAAPRARKTAHPKGGGPN